MTNKAQTILTIALTAAVSVLLVDRVVPTAEADDAQVYVLIMERSAGNGTSYAAAHDFNSLDACEAARDWKEWSRANTACFPK